MNVVRITVVVSSLVFGIFSSIANEAFAQDDSDQFEVTTKEQATTVASSFTDRLQALSPDRPMEYFELAEELAAIEGDIESRRLARGLYVLAYELDLRMRAPMGLGRSACLGLAEIADSHEEAQWLRQVGAALDRSRTPGSLAGVLLGGTESGDPSARLLLAQAIGYGRDDEGRAARTILTRPEVKPLVEHAQRALGSGSRVLNVTENRPSCPGCLGRRFNRASGEGPASLRECHVCQGNPGLGLSAEQFLRTVQVESDLVDAVHEMWGAQILADGGTPLREPDPDELARAYEVDPARPYWWSAADGSLFGRWTHEPVGDGDSARERK